MTKAPVAKSKRRRRTISEHRGSLTPAQAAAGMNHLKENSFRLLADAVLMYVSGRYPTAVTLSILAMEETGKRSILQEIVAARNSTARKRLWAQWRTHSPKLTAALQHLMAHHILNVDNRATYAAMTSAISTTIPRDIISKKEAATYVHCLPRIVWSTPNESVTKDAATEMLAAALGICSSATVTETEVRLWAQYVVPFRGTSFTKLRSAYTTYVKALEDAGVLKPGSTSLIEDVFDRIGKHLATLQTDNPLAPETFDTIKALIPKPPLVDNPPSTDS